MRRILLITIFCISTLLVSASSQSAWDGLQHEVRVGWGDPIFESAMKYELPHISKANTDVTYLTGHFFAEYQYHCLSWLSTGMIVDYSGEGWHDKRETDHRNHNCYNVSILPTIRFTYYRTSWVSLYSAIMAGVTINGGTEYSHVTHQKTICYPGVGLTALGVQVGQKGFYGAAEIGGLSALKSMNDIALFSSRMLTVSFGYKF